MNPQQPGELGYPTFGPPFVRAVIDEQHTQRKQIEKLLTEKAKEPETFKRPFSFNLNSSGNTAGDSSGGAVDLFDVGAADTFVLHRLSINLPGGTYTYGAPFNAAAGYVEIRVDGMTEDGFGLASGTGSLPCTFTPGYGKGIHVRAGSRLSLLISGGPASAQVSGVIQGTLDRGSQEG